MDDTDALEKEDRTEKQVALFLCNLCRESDSQILDTLSTSNLMYMTDSDLRLFSWIRWRRWGKLKFKRL